MPWRFRLRYPPRDFCQRHLEPAHRPGPRFGRWHAGIGWIRSSEGWQLAGVEVLALGLCVYYSHRRFPFQFLQQRSSYFQWRPLRRLPQIYIPTRRRDRYNFLRTPRAAMGAFSGPLGLQAWVAQQPARAAFLQYRPRLGEALQASENVTWWSSGRTHSTCSTTLTLTCPGQPGAGELRISPTQRLSA